MNKFEIIQYTYNFIIVLSNFLRIAIFIRIIVSWFSPGSMRNNSGVFMMFVRDITDPIFDVAKKFPHQYAMMDFSPIIAFLLIDLAAYLAKIIFISLM